MLQTTTTHARGFLLKLLATVSLFNLCKEDVHAQCVASFTHTVNDSTNTVTFTNTSTGAYTRSWWDYDGAIGLSTATNPVITFANPGYHYVCLSVDKINDPTCHSAKFCDTVFINNTAPCKSKWFYYGDTNGMLWYNATQSSGANLVYKWSFDDGSSDTTVPYPATGHQFNRKGTHKVCLTVTNLLDSTCSDSSCKIISNRGDCNAEFFVYPDTLAPAYTVTLYPRYTVPNTVYTWTFGDGSPSSSSPLPTHRYSTPGSYRVCLTVSNTADSCSVTLCDSINVSGPPMTTGTGTTYQQAKNMIIFPNPADNVLNIETAGPDIRNASITIFNATGQKVIEHKPEPQSGIKTIRLDIGALPKGIYLIEINNSGMIETRKFYKL